VKTAYVIFSRNGFADRDSLNSRPADCAAEKTARPKPGLADKYLDSSRSRRSREYLGQKEKRVEQITIDQAANIAKQEQPQLMSKARMAEESEAPKDNRYLTQSAAAGKAMAPQKSQSHGFRLEETDSDIAPAPVTDTDPAENYQVEVAPLQAVFLTDARIFIFRRIMINSQIYRQGFVLRVSEFLNHLAQTYFLTQPMAQFTGLRLSVFDQGRETGAVESGAASQHPDFF